MQTRENNKCPHRAAISDKGKSDPGTHQKAGHREIAAYWAQEYRERTFKILAETENADELARIDYLAKGVGKAGRHSDKK